MNWKGFPIFAPPNTETCADTKTSVFLVLNHLQPWSRPAPCNSLRRKFHAAGQSTAEPKIKVMGDKSPKANQKKSGQKDVKTSSANAKKSSAAAAKSAAGKKK
jgi:hypothetical protein